MKRREFVAALGASATFPLWARAETPTRTLGMLVGLTLGDWAFAGVRAGLSEAGYAEGSNLNVIYREGPFDQLPRLAAELVNSKVDVIFATGSPVPARAAKAATSTIPIVFAYGGDPVADGLVESFNRPGGNVTGATFIGSTLLAKRMELMREIVPQVTDVALLVNLKGTLAERQIKDATGAAATLGQRLHVLNTGTLDDLDAAFATMERSKVGAFICSTDPFFGFIGHDRLLNLAQRYKIPGIYNAREEVGTGGLVSYGPNLRDTWRQAGVYVGRILKGERPQDLPVMQPTKFEIVINLKVANELGLTIPPTLLGRADEVIE
jgi:putative tryptophan/tyrosine transport system substrate-binding protein